MQELKGHSQGDAQALPHSSVPAGGKAEGPQLLRGKEGEKDVAGHLPSWELLPCWILLICAGCGSAALFGSWGGGQIVHLTWEGDSHGDPVGCRKDGVFLTKCMFPTL